MADFLQLIRMVIENSQAIPPQEEGKQVDIVETIKASNKEEAKLIFRQARQRLFDISTWSQISEGISALFLLTDQHGKEKQGMPARGDHVRIDIPGPGASAGEGYDWVRVEMIDDNPAPEDKTEWTIIKVRPSENPATKEGVAHFFDEDATSSFIVKREDDLISAEVHGRNEKPNTSAENLPDKIRNAVVGIGAVAGFAKIQWQKLVKGLLNTRGV
jgi:hypothetical protein